LTANQGGYNL